MHNNEWELFYKNEVVGYLNSPIYKNMPQHYFTVISKNNYEKIVFDENLWHNGELKYFNVKRNEYAPIATLSGELKIDGNSAVANMRGMNIFAADIKRINFCSFIFKILPFAILLGTFIFIVVYLYIKLM
jgi:hypothetical protein